MINLYKMMLFIMFMYSQNYIHDENMTNSKYYYRLIVFNVYVNGTFEKCTKYLIYNCLFDVI